MFREIGNFLTGAESNPVQEEKGTRWKGGGLMSVDKRVVSWLELQKLRTQALWGIFGGIALLIPGAAVFITGRMVPGVLMLLTALGALIWGFTRSNRYTKSYKDVIVRTALERTFDDLVFDPEAGFSRAMLAETRMIAMGNRYHSDDFVSGSYQGVPFQRADVLIQQVTSTGKTTTVVTLFKGPWMIFDFGKPFRCDLQVTERGFGSNRKHTGLFGLGATMTEIKTESAAFNERFRVFAESEHEAFYLLTPALMERIRTLAAHVDGKLMLCFIDGRLHVAVYSNKNEFEPSLFRAPDRRDTERVQASIGLITTFVSTLKLTENIMLWKGSVE